jgi:hypothetical protein
VSKTKSYTLRPEHEARFGEWRDKWIANALNCEPMGEMDKDSCRTAVMGLFNAAKLKCPPRIIFVPSPFVLRVAAGFAAAIWHKRKTGNNAATYAATRDATRAATRDATRAATRAATNAATNAATRDATDAATNDATDAATNDATYAATDAATRDATDAATNDATYAATRDATRAATRDATNAATNAATDAATDAATNDATDAATNDATDAATYAAYFSPWAPDQINRLARLCAPECPSLAMACAARYWGWTGGNQWSGWVAYLSFFQDVALLGLKQYEAFSHYRALAEHAGPRVIHDEFVMISDRPEFIKRDERGRPHCIDGAFTRWRDGSEIYAFHGVYVPRSWTNGGLTVKALKETTNAEQRRVGVEVYGRAKFLRDTGAKVLHADIGDRSDARALVVDDEAKRWLVCTDGSTGRTYTMLVPSEVTTCAQAYTALCGVKDEDCVGAG